MSKLEIINDNHLQIAENTLNTDEGLVQFPYQDTKGIWTVGYGFNLQTTPMPRKVAVLWLTCLVEERDKLLETKFGYYKDLSDVRKAVLINMSYQLGMNGLYQFKKMHKALMVRDVETGIKEMKDSAWYRNHKSRANRLCYMMRFDEYITKQESKSYYKNFINYDN